MKGIRVEATELTPLFQWLPEEGTINLIGISGTGVNSEFWQIPIELVEALVLEGCEVPIRVNINLDYFSVASTAPLFKFLKALQGLSEVVIFWWFEDCDIEQVGREFESILNLKFHFLHKGGNPDDSI